MASGRRRGHSPARTTLRCRIGRATSSAWKDRCAIRNAALWHEDGTVAFTPELGNEWGTSVDVDSGTVPVPAAVAIVIVAHHRPVTVIHGRGVDAVFVLAAQGLSGPLSTLIMRATSAPPSLSTAASASGGSAWSCVHSPLKLIDIRCMNKCPDIKNALKLV